jgi:hypothetical protein
MQRFNSRRFRIGTRMLARITLRTRCRLCWIVVSGNLANRCWPRRRNLTRNGTSLTDIDAIGEQISALLLVSCKSFVYTDQHDVGEYSAIRNAASDCRKYVNDWRAKVEDLRRNPLGDNYDFRFAERFIGVVCTPQVVFVYKDVLDQQAAHDLPMAASFDELADWVGVVRSYWNE